MTHIQAWPPGLVTPSISKRLSGTTPAAGNAKSR